MFSFGLLEVLPQPVEAALPYGAPMSTPSLRAMLAAWRAITKQTEDFLNALTTRRLLVDLPLNGKKSGRSQEDLADPLDLADVEPVVIREPADG